MPYVKPLRPEPYGAILADTPTDGVVTISVTDWGPQQPTLEPVSAFVVVDLAGKPDVVVLQVDGSEVVRVNSPAPSVRMSKQLVVGSHRLTVWAENDSSADITGKPRIVTVLQKPVEPPVDPPQPVAGIVTALKSEHGKYLRVMPDGSVDAAGDDAGPWEQLEVITL